MVWRKAMRKQRTAQLKRTDSELRRWLHHSVEFPYKWRKLRNPDLLLFPFLSLSLSIPGCSLLHPRRNVHGGGNWSITQ